MTVVLDEFQNAETVEPALLNNPRLKARGFLTRCRLSRNSQGF